MLITQKHAQSIVDEMKAAIHRDVNIMDESGIILASTNPTRRGQIHAGAVQIIRNQLPALTIWENDSETGVQRGINLPITMGGELVGVIGVTGDPEEVSIFGDIIKRMTEIMIDSVRQQEQSDLIDRAKSLFVENWLFADRPDWSELEVRGRLLGLNINAPYTVALLDLSDQESGGLVKAEDLSEMRSGRILRMIQNHIQDDRNHFCTVIRNRIIVLLRGVSRSAALSKISRMCQDIESYYAIPISAGISDASKDPMDIRRCYLEAQTANVVAAQSARERVVFYDQVSLEFIVQSIPRAIKRDLQKLLFSSCTPQEKAEFTQTVSLYFDQDGDIRRCADKLFLHRNTFQYRMDHLRKKTGYDLRIPKNALLLYLAVRED
ncbi:MAG: sugar diacid recognition domain-containing protein [Lawsonibacter sp.]|nr:sugar diacid recognition domain-containing protein [Lawsonibacter sp.]